MDRNHRTPIRPGSRAGRQLLRRSRELRARCRPGDSASARRADASMRSASWCLLKGRRNRVVALGPDLREHRVERRCAHRGAARRDRGAGRRGDRSTARRSRHPAPPSQSCAPRHSRAASGDVIVRNCWMLRLPPSASFFAQMRSLGLIPRFGSFLALHSLQYAIYILSWTVLGIRRAARAHRAGLAAGVGAAADHHHSSAHARIVVAGAAVDRHRRAAQATPAVRRAASSSPRKPGTRVSDNCSAACSNPTRWKISR